MFEGVKGVGVKIKNLIANVSTFCIEVIINYCTVCKTRNISFKWHIAFETVARDDFN